MKNTLHLLLIFILLAACKKPPVQNLAPVANAGLDISILLPVDSATLNGSTSSDTDGTIASYQWTLISGPAGSSLSTETLAITTVKGLTSGVFEFELKVTDDKGATATDKVEVIVSDPNADPPAYGTPYDNVPALEDIVMYEVNQRAYSTSGDFQGIINRLDSIKALGINVIWLMPIHPIGAINSVNSPYSVSNYKAVNPEYGTLEDLRELVEKSHQKGMSVIIDWVANHTAWDNPWITNTDWYSQDGNGNIIIPPGTNWNDVADLNFNNQEMRLEMIKAMKYWILTANIDGFRVDAADLVPFSFWQQALDTLTNMPDRDLILLAEGSRMDHLTAGFQMTYAWDFYTTLKNVFMEDATANNCFITNNAEYSGMPAGKKRLRFTTNHDHSAWEATPMTLFNGKQGALAAAVIAAYMNGVPLIYGSQEVGRVNTVPFFTNSPINWTQNPDMLAAYKAIFAVYNTTPALRKGTLQPYINNDIVSFKKSLDAEQVVVLVNTRNSAINYTLPPAIVNTSWVNAFSGAPVELLTSISLGPYEYVVLKNQ